MGVECTQHDHGTAIREREGEGGERQAAAHKQGREKGAHSNTLAARHEMECFTMCVRPKCGPFDVFHSSRSSLGHFFVREKHLYFPEDSYCNTPFIPIQRQKGYVNKRIKLNPLHGIGMSSSAGATLNRAWMNVGMEKAPNYRVPPLCSWHSGSLFSLPSSCLPPILLS